MATDSLRRALASIIAATLDAVDPVRTVGAALRAEGTKIMTPRRTYDTANYRRAIVVGAGKAGAPMAAAVEDILTGCGIRIDGLVIVRYGYQAPTKQIFVVEAGHPIPDQAGLNASARVAALVEAATEDDLVIVLLSGGASALMTLPVPGISLDDLKQTTNILLRSGATIRDVNAVRKRLDRVKGGGLARLAAPADVLTLVMSDVVGDSLDAIGSGPTVRDTTTWADAAAVLDRFSLWTTVPEPVAARLRSGLGGQYPASNGQAGVFEHVETVVVANNRAACAAASAEAKRLGFASRILTSELEGEARDIGSALGTRLRQIATGCQPVASPLCLIAGGETTVTVRGPGVGGRNQEVALAASIELAGLDNVLFASVGTDGSDGPTNAAGAIADGSTLARAIALGLDADSILEANDSYSFFDQLGDLVRTGPTRTNVNDIVIMLAGTQEA